MDKLKTLTEILNLLKPHDSMVKKDDLVVLFKALQQAVAQIEPSLTRRVDSRLTQSATSVVYMERKARQVIDEVTKKAERIVLNAKALQDKQLTKATKVFEQRVEELLNELRTKAEEEDVEDYVEDRLEALAEEYSQSPEKIRDSLETLEGNERLDKSAIKGLTELEKDLQGRISMVIGGPRGVSISADGTDLGFTQYVNLIAGTGVTITTNRVGERVDMTISASGGSFSILTATGSINDTNTSFTFASEPTLVVVNGDSYRDGKGCSISGTSVTLDSPVGTGGDIYGIG